MRNFDLKCTKFVFAGLHPESLGDQASSLDLEMIERDGREEGRRMEGMGPAGYETRERGEVTA